MLYYHYTVAPKLPAILADGRIKPTTVNREPDEKPILWFSVNPVWERTAAKGDGRGGTHSFETHRDRIGLCRFVFDQDQYPSREMYWFNDIARRANMPEMVRLRLAVAGAEYGANYQQWYGTLRGMSLKMLEFETCTEGKKWVPGDPATFAPRVHIQDLGPMRTTTPH